MSRPKVRLVTRKAGTVVAIERTYRGKGGVFVVGGLAVRPGELDPFIRKLLDVFFDATGEKWCGPPNGCRWCGS